MENKESMIKVILLLITAIFFFGCVTLPPKSVPYAEEQTITFTIKEAFDKPDNPESSATLSFENEWNEKQ